MIASSVYILCAFTSLLCATLLTRSYRSTKSRMLFWSSIFFYVLTLSNLLLCFDYLVFPDNDLSLSRSITTLVAIIVLLYGLIWKEES